MRFALVSILFAVFTAEVFGGASPYVWRCDEDERICKKSRREKLRDDEPFYGLETCRMVCSEYANLWPRPSHLWESDRKLSSININSIEITSNSKGNSDSLLDEAVNRFRKMISKLTPGTVKYDKNCKTLVVKINNENPNLREFSLKMDESYRMRISRNPDGHLVVDLSAHNFFGVRHGLETLSQLIVYDEAFDQVKVLDNVTISDGPAFTYRGVLLDTSRNYYTIESIKATIDAMAVVKLNTLHWHITDAQSFPFVSERRPELSHLGAYSPEKVYNRSMIVDVVRFARARGVRVMPEFDAPAHVGEGWQDTDFLVCFNAQPWSNYCVEPPCGQFDPTKQKLYEYLEDIFADMNDSFKPDIFHMGGDEVQRKCWDNYPQITEFVEENRWQNPGRGVLEDGAFLRLWDYFQKNAEERAKKVFGNDKPLVLWTSGLTASPDVEKYIDKSRYIIQVWTEHGNKQVDTLLEKGYKLILSYYDSLYLDCGFGSWISSGNNWCSPYIGWNKIYSRNTTTVHEMYQNQIYGGEAALWSEQSDSSTLDGRLWPRAAALAEMLWSNPGEDWHRAQFRMLGLRERLVRLGIQADSLQPEWCRQNEGDCSSR